MDTSLAPIFWRDSRIPYAELRYIGDARQVAYAAHSHVHWSLGAVTRGQSTFKYRNDSHLINAGDLVLMNPYWVHACNPLEDQPWAYWMLYVDTQWVSELRYRAGLLATPQWADITAATVSRPDLYHRYCRMAACLVSDSVSLADKTQALTETLVAVLTHLDSPPSQAITTVPAAISAVAEYLDQHATQALSLATLCRYSGYSEGHLIRAFKHYLGITPHAYLVNRRVQLGQQRLKYGQSIAETALDMGFNDQPHFQRTFKRLVAATPQQYRAELIDQQKEAAGSQQ